MHLVMYISVERTTYRSKGSLCNLKDPAPIVLFNSPLGNQKQQSLFPKDFKQAALTTSKHLLLSKHLKKLA